MLLLGFVGQLILLLNGGIQASDLLVELLLVSFVCGRLLAHLLLSALQVLLVLGAGRL